MAQIIVRSLDGTLTHQILAGPRQEHRLLCDEPLERGGLNLGPTPYDLLLGALGSCTGITVMLYAQRKQWKLSAVIVKLSHDRIHAEDCADCESETGFISNIARELTFEGDLNEEQRDKLLLIAQHCPVHKTLKNEIMIRDHQPEVRPLQGRLAS